MLDLINSIEPLTLLTAVLTSATCALAGSLLVVRRMSLLGDAISHAILPGLAMGFILSGSRAPLYMLIGAAVTGLLTAFLSQALTNFSKLPADTIMGVVFTSFFAVGVILITWVARDIDLDPGCVLYGLIEFVPFDTVHIFGVELPKALAWNFAIFPLTLCLIGVFYKEIKIVAFDSTLAAALGFSVPLIHYGLMTLIAVIAVSSFESVGSILVVGMLTAPGATAYLLTDKLHVMIILSALIGATAAVIGYLLAVMVNTSIAGMIAGAGLLIFLVVLFIAPKHGILAKEFKRFLLALRIAEEDILGALYRAQEKSEHVVSKRLLTTKLSPITSSAPLIRKIALRKLAFNQEVAVAGTGVVTLSPRAFERAQAVIRRHRLWESFLSKELQLPEDHLHSPSERVEHFITEKLQAELQQELGGQNKDPHGTNIP
ncbi:metal ABC transporter permease [bacterium]|nr:metal ABC transporter permease [bacterium]